VDENRALLSGKAGDCGVTGKGLFLMSMLISEEKL